MDEQPLEQRLSSRFGTGPAARAAIQQAAQDPQFQNMFQFNNQVASGIEGRQDHLSAAAADVLHPNQPRKRWEPAPSTDDTPQPASHPPPAPMPQTNYTPPAYSYAPAPTASPAASQGQQYAPAPTTLASHAHAAPAPTSMPSRYQSVVQAARSRSPPRTDSDPGQQPQQRPTSPSPLPSPTAATQARAGTRTRSNAAQAAVSSVISRPPIISHVGYIDVSSPQRQRQQYDGHRSGSPREHVSMANVMRQSAARSPRRPHPAIAALAPQDANALQRQYNSPAPNARPASAGPGVSSRLTQPTRASRAGAGAGRGAGTRGADRPASRGRRARAGRGSPPRQNRSPQQNPWMSPGVGAQDGVPNQQPNTPGSASPPISGTASPARSAGRRSPGRWTREGYVTLESERQREEREQANRERKQRAEEFYRKYRVKQHMGSYADYSFSQPRSQGIMVTVGQHNMSFDEAHPALADQHYLRTEAQDKILYKERAKATKNMMRRSLQDTRKSRPGTPTTDQLARDVERLSVVRDAGNARLRELRQDGEDVRAQSRDVRDRAMDAIKASEHISRRYRSRSASPNKSAWTPSPNYARLSPPPRRSGNASSRTISPSDRPLGYDGSSRGEGAPRSSPGWVSDEDGQFRQPGNQPYNIVEYNSLYNSTRDRQQGIPEATQQAWAGVPWERDVATQSGRDNEGGSLADYIARDSGVRVQGAPVGPALTEAEFRMASGAFDEAKYEEYNRQMDLEMQQRSIERGYHSDEEREAQAAEAAALAALSAEERSDIERRAQEARDLQALLQQTWGEQDSWMDYYRERLGPREGYARSDMGGEAIRSPHSEPGALTEHDEQMLEEHFVPVLSSDLAAQGLFDGYDSDGPRGRHRHTAKRFTPTKPVGFAFEERYAQRPKSIMKVKLEQDLALRQQEEEAARKHQFKASPVPVTSSMPRYAELMLRAEVRRQVNKDSRLAQLSSLVEKPFSFQERDEYLALQRETNIAVAKDPNRFQIPFYAKAVPDTVKEDKYRFMMFELEARRAHARQRMEDARIRARQRAEQDMKQRQEMANRSYQERLRVIDPVWNSKYVTKSPGAVPDFDLLHTHWEQRLVTLRALNRRNLTVPVEFGTHNARNGAEKAARERKALERRQRIIIDMALDSELLPEMRWPNKMPRGRVRPSPPPPMLQPDTNVPDTRANMLRRTATQLARKAGHFDDPHDRERRALAKARKEARTRAAAYIKMKQGRGGGGDDSVTLDTTAGGGMSDSGAIGDGGHRPKGLSGAAPNTYIEARHAQAQRKAKEEVEAVLLSKGMAAYNEVRYHEENDDKNDKKDRGY